MRVTFVWVQPEERGGGCMLDFFRLERGEDCRALSIAVKGMTAGNFYNRTSSIAESLEQRRREV
jgi:hypothetical protein